jgi:hypothetical protein
MVAGIFMPGSCWNHMVYERFVGEGSCRRQCVMPHGGEMREFGWHASHLSAAFDAFGVPGAGSGNGGADR